MFHYKFGKSHGVPENRLRLAKAMGLVFVHPFLSRCNTYKGSGRIVKVCLINLIKAFATMFILRELMSVFFMWHIISACEASWRIFMYDVHYTTDDERWLDSTRASSGIASLLLNGGRTAHSRFHIPLNLTEDSVCNIKPDSDVAYLLNETKLIIWDEAPMVHKYAFEALDRTLNDVFNMDTSIDSETPFGGKVIVFGGDFRQILPVVPNGGRQEIVNASLSSSYIWSKCKLLTLTKNMRLTVGADTSDMERTSDPISSLIEFVYPSILENFNNINYFSERAILAPKNEVVHEINDRLLSVFPGEEIVYLSSDTICQTEQVNKDRFQEKLYSPDVLNGLKISGLPNHRLALKVGVPVMLLRNIDQQNGLCNGTRLQVKSLGKRVIEAEIISGGNIVTRTFIPRINMIPSDNNIPFKFQRRQFPLSVCFAMTINKSQGQSLARVGLYLKEPVFSHGQLYVALSRVKSRDGVKLLILDKEGKPTNKTTNVVYKEIFREL